MPPRRPTPVRGQRHRGEGGRARYCQPLAPVCPECIGAIDASANRVAVSGGIVAAAIEANPETDPGSVVIYNATHLRKLGEIPTGFAGFNSQADALRRDGVRIDGIGDLDQRSVPGARSFSIWPTTARRRSTAATRSSASPRSGLAATSTTTIPGARAIRAATTLGPEPEALAIARLVDRQFAFDGLERMGGIMVHDTSHPRDARFVPCVNDRNFSIAVDDLDDTTSGDAGNQAPSASW